MKVDLEELYNNMNNICVKYRNNEWSNDWTDNGSKFLITLDLDKYNIRDEFSYDDIEYLSIEIKNEMDEVRIDITKLDEHYYWLINTPEEWLYVKTYVEDLVKMQYEHIMKTTDMFNLLDGAYYEPPVILYKKCKNVIRERKLERICNE